MQPSQLIGSPMAYIDGVVGIDDDLVFSKLMTLVVVQ